MAVSIILRLDN